MSTGRVRRRSWSGSDIRHQLRRIFEEPIGVIEHAFRFHDQLAGPLAEDGGVGGPI